MAAELTGLAQQRRVVSAFVRVLWVVKGLGPGGAERLLVAAANAHDRERFHIECAYVLPWKDHLVGELESAGVRTHCLSVRRTDRRWPLRLAKLIRSGAYDVVHVHSPLPGSVARLAARSMRSADRPGVVSTEHNRWETHRLPTRLLNRTASRWDDASFAVTDEVRESMSGRVGKQAVTLRHGIDIDRVAAERAHRADVRKEFGIADDEFVVVTAANFRPQKDYPNLLGAARLLADREVPVRIVAIGQGPQEAEMRALHESLDLGDRVILTGFRGDATRVMAACDAFTLASKWEGLPVAVMEALAIGLPIVATNVGGMAEELSDDVDALLVPPGDSEALAAAIERVATDHELCTRLAKAAAARSPEFAVARTVAEIESTYGRVAHDAPADASAEEAPPAKRPVAPKPALDIRPAEREDRDAIITLLQRSLGSDGDLRYPELFAWKHDTNRFGPSPMWVATDGGRVVAFRALMRWEFVRGGKVLRAVRAVDTATDPDYQGRGLFRALTMHGLAEVKADGVDFVFNTPNDQSRPGYLKMGWREVGRLPAAVRFTGPTGALKAARSRVPADRWSTGLDVGGPVLDWLAAGGSAGRLPASTDVREIRTNIDDEYLVWRFGTSLLGYRVVDDGDSAVIVRARMRGRSKELAVVAEFGDPGATQRLAARTARQAGCSYAIRIGRPHPRAGYVGLPGGGPILTWRAVNDAGFPPLANWALSLGDVELF
jgi:glycosyltransferase involved in cell wall biosynthesis/GNAT superfamily N-acetyltransferase